MKSTIIPKIRFIEVFNKIGWIQSEANSGRYHIFTSPQDKSVYTLIPTQEDSEEYTYYQDRNIKMLLYALEIEETVFNYEELVTQLLNYNYKLLNRIVATNKNNNDVVPFELASVLSTKTIDAFRTFYAEKSGKSIPIEKFELNHTQQGSFVIPISILADEEQTFELIPNKTNQILRDYLNSIDRLSKIGVENKQQFAAAVIDAGLDSRLIKDFMSKTDSIARVKSKYKDQFSEITIEGKSNPILDIKLQREEKIFKHVDLEKISILDDEYIQLIEKIEVDEDSQSRNEKGATIDVVVESLESHGNVKFSVLTINQEKLKKPFKSTTTELPKAKLDYFTDAFKSRDIIQLSGDIIKAKGKVGKIIIDEIEKRTRIKTLFEE